MECPRKHKFGSGSDFTLEGVVQPHYSRDGWSWSGVAGQIIGSPLIADELQGVSKLWCRSAMGDLALTGQKGFCPSGGLGWKLGVGEACR